MLAAFKRDEIMWAVEKSSNQGCCVCVHACCRSQQKVVGSWWWVLEGKINMKEISNLSALWPREDGRVSGEYSHMASSMHDRTLTCICGLNSKKLFREVFLSPCSFHDRIVGIWGIFNARRIQAVFIFCFIPCMENVYDWFLCWTCF